jgi:hypothetical protein
MDLGESIKPHTSRWATTGDRLMVEYADSMTAPAPKETEATSLLYLPIQFWGRKSVSVESENNFALSFASSGRGPLLYASYYGSLLRLWTRQFNCRGSLKRAGATPRTFWAAESRKSGVAPARFGSFPTAAF